MTLSPGEQRPSIVGLVSRKRNVKRKSVVPEPCKDLKLLTSNNEYKFKIVLAVLALVVLLHFLSNSLVIRSY